MSSAVELYEIERPGLVVWLRQRVGDDAEDLAQDAALTCWLRERQQPVSRSYLWQAARWDAIDLARRQALIPFGPLDDDAYRVPACDDRGLLELSDVLDALAPRERLTVERYAERARDHETCVELGVSRSRVSRLRTRALAHLRALLEQEGAEGPP